MRYWGFWAFLAALSYSVPALARVELRLHYANSVYAAEDFNSYLTTSPNDLSGLRDQISLGADIIYAFRSYPFLVGLRVEQMAKAKSSTGTLDSTAGTYNVSVTRQIMSLITGYRLSNMETYFGFILGLGVSDATTLKVDASTYRSFASTNYYGGIELGAQGKLSSFGIELGYLSSSATNFKLNDVEFVDATGEKIVFDMNGPYLKFVLSLLF